MNIIHLITYDSEGGAARAAMRINKALIKQGHNSQLFVLFKSTDVQSVKAVNNSKWTKFTSKFLRIFDYLYIKERRLLKQPFSFGKYGIKLKDADLKLIKNADVVNLHWINHGFLNIKELDKIFKLGKPVVWTLHDMWAFTGGCHYTGDCFKYEEQCGTCQYLNSNNENDKTKKLLGKKEKAYKNANINIVTCSKWLGECAQNSSVLRNEKIKVVPNCIDTDLYKPIDKTIAREILNLPQDKKLILFGAMSATTDERKGFKYIKESLKIVGKEKNQKIELVVFGSSYSKDIEEFKIKTHFLGRVYDDYTLSLIYSACDVFVAPSIQENLANTVVESLACGTPVVAFNIGGMPDMIEHERNGYLCEFKDSEDLAVGIKWCLEEKRVEMLCNNSREKVMNNYTEDKVSKEYLNVYNSLINSNEE